MNRKQFFTVTTFSKVVAMVVFIAVPLFFFKLGLDYGKAMGYGESISQNNNLCTVPPPLPIGLVPPLGILPTIPQEQVAPTVMITVSPVNVDWLTYSKRFGYSNDPNPPLHTFRYPGVFEVKDSDPDSGEIYLFSIIDKSKPVLTLDTLAHSGLGQSGMPAYAGGSTRVWFKNMLTEKYKNKDTDIDPSRLVFNDIVTSSGKKYLRIDNFARANYGESEAPSYYFAIQNDIPFYVSTSIGEADVMAILSTIEIRP